MASLTRDQVLAKRLDLPREPVTVPGLGGTVYVRVLSLAGLVKLIAATKAAKEAGKEHLDLALVTAATACDADGKLLFTDADTETLLELPMDVLKTVAEAAMKLNKMGDDGFEDAVKN